MIRHLPGALVLAVSCAWAGFAAAQTTPAAPTGLTGWETETRRVVTLQWDDPDDSTITKYQWRHSAQDGAFNSWADISGSGARTTTTGRGARRVLRTRASWERGRPAPDVD